MSATSMGNADAPIVIIGGGPAGLTAAYEVIRHGGTPIVLEKSAHVGGIARTEEHHGNRFDIGGHRFFTKVAEVQRIWEEVLGDCFIQVPRLSRIFYGGRFYKYPLSIFNTLWNLGPIESLLILLSYLRIKTRIRVGRKIGMPPLAEDTLEQWVTNRFGQQLYRTFFKTYTEKVWGIPCNQIRADWAAQRIKGLSLKAAVLNALFKYGNAKSLITEFDYPRLGPGQMWERFAEIVNSRGGRVHMHANAAAVKHANGRATAVVYQVGEKVIELPAAHVVTSMPLPELIRKLDPPAPSHVLAAAEKLSFRDFILVGLVLRKQNIFPDNWIYIHAPEVKVGRIQNFGNWSKDMVADPQTTSLGMEYFCTRGDPLWEMSNDDLIALAKKEIALLGLTGGAEATDGYVIRQEKAYPVYDAEYSTHVDTLREYLATFANLQTVGRNGMHRYNNQDHSMLTALLAVRNIYGARHDLWNVNVERSYHEEFQVKPGVTESKVSMAGGRTAAAWSRTGDAMTDSIALSSSTPPPTDHAAQHAHLQVDQLSRDLKHRSTRGGAMMLVSAGLQLAVGVGSTAVLARMLEPRDFGYLAMVSPFANFVTTLREFLQSPAIYKQDLSPRQASGLFWINALTGFLMALLVAAAAPLLARFFHEPRLTAITLVLAAGLMFNMLGMIHLGLLHRQMKYGAVSLVEVGSIVAGAVAGIAAALLGAGYSALVVQQLATWIWQSGVSFLLCAWRPLSRRDSAFGSDEGVRAMLRYGKDTTVSRFITYVSRNTDFVLIGHFAGPSVLGLYQKAFQWAMMPFWQIYNPIFVVATSSLSRLQNDPTRYRSYVRATLLSVFGLSLPAMALVVVEADGIVRLLLGAKWVEAIPMLRILSTGAYFSGFTMAMSRLYLPEGRTADQMRWSLFSAPVMVAAVAIGMHWHAVGVATGFAVASILLVAPGVWYCLRRSPLRASDFFQAVWRPVTASLIAAAVLALLRETLPATPHALLQLATHGVIYSLLYITCWLILPGGRASWSAFIKHLRTARRPAT